MSEVTKPADKPAKTDLELCRMVFATLGSAPSLANHFSTEQRAEIVATCTEGGEAVDGVAVKFRDWFIADHKKNIAAAKIKPAEQRKAERP